MSRSQSEFDVMLMMLLMLLLMMLPLLLIQSHRRRDSHSNATFLLIFLGGFLKMQLRCLLICLGLSLGLLMLTTPVCEARRGRGRGRTKSRVQIGLPITGKYRDPESDQYYNNNNGAKILQASHFDLEYVLGHKIAFLCVAKGNPRPHITWYKDGAEIYQHLYMHVHEWRIGDDRVKSKIEIDPATQMDAGLYECTADNMYSIDRRSFKTDFSIAFD